MCTYFDGSAQLSYSSKFYGYDMHGLTRAERAFISTYQALVHRTRHPGR
jgi:hypothetical protein